VIPNSAVGTHENHTVYKSDSQQPDAEIFENKYKKEYGQYRDHRPAGKG